ncbi:hypothetical protein [Altibacter lentus]|uniref:hypothetical protein n=1 Tax=Altibacter lentus TaxID=1223410 RepID=UPI00054F256C|nr:hypothetical protein [Altibacter lentus]
MKKLVLLLFCSSCYLGLSQVGIGTVSPSDAAMLDISSTTNNVNYGGLMPPRVPSQTERDVIPTTSTDTGLLIFVESTGTLEVWNGINWEIVYTLSTQATTLAIQDFDTNISWNYTVTPATYNVSDDIWDIVTTLGAGTGAIDLVSGNFLGCRDLDNPNGGGNFFHEIAFVNVNVSSLNNARISFDYDVYQYDAGDDIQYEVYHDDVSQGVVTLVNGAGNLTAEGTEVIVVPNSVTNVRISVRIDQNGNDDFAGFDNFRVYGQ